MPETAQELFRHVMRDIVGCELRELGFRGSYSRVFWISEGDYDGIVATQKSRYSTKAEVDFTVYLSAVHGPTSATYWQSQLLGLIPGNRQIWWTVRVGSPAEPVAENVLDEFRRCGWPAIQAALDDPGYPPDPNVHWPRQFPPRPEWGRMISPPDLGDLALVLQPAGRPADGRSLS
jgi:hypothetical protein